MFGFWDNVAALGGGAAAPAVTLNPTSGTNKYSGITLSNGNLTMSPDNSGNYEFVRATRAANSGDVQFEVTVIDHNVLVISIEDGTQDFSTAGASGATAPGDSGHPSSGLSFYYVDGNGFVAFITGGSTVQFPSATIANGDKLTVQINKAAGTAKLLQNGTQLGTTVTGLTWTNWYAALGGVSVTTGVMSVNFAGPFSFGSNAAY